MTAETPPNAIALRHTRTPVMAAATPSAEVVKQPSSEFGFGRTFVVNFGYGGLRGCVFLLNTLIIAPLLLFHLGAERFAIFALITPFLRYGFNGVFDMGFCTGIVRYISGACATGDDEAVNRYITTAIAAYLFCGGLLTVGFRLIGPMLVGILVQSNPALAGTAEMILGRCLIAYTLYLLSNAFFALLMGAQHLHATHIIGMVSMLVETGGMLALARAGLTVNGVVLVYQASASIGLVLSAALAYHYWPHLRISFSRFHLGELRDLSNYCMRYSVTVSTALLAPIIDKLLLARFGGLTFVAAYEAAARLVEICRRASQLILLPLFPIAGAMLRTSSAKQRHALYQRVFAANVPLSAALYLVPVPFASAIFRLWLGPTIAHTAAVAFIVLSITAFLLSVVNPACILLVGSGRMRLLIITGLGSLFSNLFVSAALAYRFRFSGVLAGGLLAYGAMALIMLFALQRMPEFSLHSSRSLLTSVVTVASAIVPGTLLVGVIVPRRPEALGVASAAAVLAFLIGVSLFGENRRAVLDILHQVRTVRAQKRTPEVNSVSHA